MTTEFIDEEDTLSVHIRDFDVKRVIFGRPDKKDLPEHAEAPGHYFLSYLSYKYPTPDGDRDGPILIEFDKMRADKGIALVKGKKGKSKGKIVGESVPFAVNPSDEQCKILVQKMNDLYYGAFKHFNSDKGMDCDKIDSYVDKDIDITAYRKAFKRWTGLVHPLYYGKDLTKTNDNNFCSLSCPLKKYEPLTVFTTPYRKCIKCPANSQCDNPNHKKAPIKIPIAKVKKIAFDGIPVISLTAIFFGAPKNRFKFELKTCIVVNPRSKGIATTQTKTFDELEKAGFDESDYSSRLGLGEQDEEEVTVEVGSDEVSGEEDKKEDKPKKKLRRAKSESEESEKSESEEDKSPPPKKKNVVTRKKTRNQNTKETDDLDTA